MIACSSNFVICISNLKFSLFCSGESRGIVGIHKVIPKPYSSCSFCYAWLLISEPKRADKNPMRSHFHAEQKGNYNLPLTSVERGRRGANAILQLQSHWEWGRASRALWVLLSAAFARTRTIAGWPRARSFNGITFAVAFDSFNYNYSSSLAKLESNCKRLVICILLCLL